MDLPAIGGHWPHPGLASEVLAHDIINGMVQPGMKPKQVWLSRTIYQQYSLPVFRRKMYCMLKQHEANDEEAGAHVRENPGDDGVGEA